MTHSTTTTASETYAVQLPRTDAHQLGAARTVVGLEICPVDDRIWLRMRSAWDTLPLPLKSLPRGEIFQVLTDGQLVRSGSRVPSGVLPEGPWIRLAEWLRIEWPTAAFPGERPSKVVPELVPSDRVREPNALLVSWDVWAAYAVTAPQIRLDRWHFAMSNLSPRTALIRGTPLPPLPGLRFVEEQGVAVPCGWHRIPAIDVDVLARIFDMTPPDVLLWTSDGRRERISADHFVKATRSAVRCSSP